MEVTIAECAHTAMPVLMLNTRDDFLFPYETSQRPMFATLGTPAAQKLHVVQDVGGHSPRRTDIARHILDWLDRWLGTIDNSQNLSEHQDGIVSCALVPVY